MNNLIKQAIIKFHNNNVPIVICPPVDETITPKLHSKILKDNRSNREEAVQKYDSYLTHENNLSKPYMKLEDQKKLSQELRKMLPATQSFLADQVVKAITLFEADKELLTLLKIISKLNIPYVGICDEAFATTTDINKFEDEFKYMTNEVYSKAVPALNKSNGVIICDIGINYSHELAVRLKKIAQSLESSQIDIKICSIFSHSLYVSDQLSAHEDLIKDLYKLNSNEIKDIHKQMPCSNMFIKENINNGTFYSQNFVDKIGDIIEYVNDHN